MQGGFTSQILIEMVKKSCYCSQSETNYTSVFKYKTCESQANEKYMAKMLLLTFNKKSNKLFLDLPFFASS